ncbi:hypothetical protein [uncultured Gammaproteobacteria bacterium]|nr:hypothetical protein [uncultured Gammaproteobacteria bacterium]
MYKDQFSLNLAEILGTYKAKEFSLIPIVIFNLSYPSHI